MPNISQLNGISNGFIGVGSDNSTSSTSITQLNSVSINANTFTANDYISFGGLFYKTTPSVSNCFFYLYVNSADTLTNAVQVGTYRSSVNDGVVYLNRRMLIKNASGGGTGNSVGTQTISSTSDLISDYSASTTSNLVLDWTKEVWFIAAGKVANVADTALFSGFKVFKY